MRGHHPQNSAGLQPLTLAVRRRPSYLQKVRNLVPFFFLAQIAFGTAAEAVAQENPSKAVELTLLTREFDALDGLSSNCIYHIEQDRLGFMWFATSKGMDRFDGSRFVNHLYSDLVQPEQSLARVIIDMTATSDTAFQLTLAQALRFPQTDTTFHFLPLTPDQKAPAIEQRISRDALNPLGTWRFTSQTEKRRALFVDDTVASPEFEEDRPFSLWKGGPKDSLLLFRSFQKQSILLFRTADGIGHTQADCFLHMPSTQGQADPHILSFDGESLLFFARKIDNLYPKGTLVRQSMTGGHEAIGHWNDWFPFPFIPSMHRSVIRINPWNGDIWCFLDNQLAVITPTREVRWSGTISEHLQFASLINAIQFTNEHQVWVGSCKGLMLIQTEPDHFEALFTASVTLNDDIGGIMDGLNSCRGIQELGPDSFAFATNGHGVRLFAQNKTRMLVNEYGGGAGLFLKSDTLFIAGPDGLTCTTEKEELQWLQQGSFPTTHWSLHPGEHGNWLVGATGVFEVDPSINKVEQHAMPAGKENGFVYQFTSIRDTLWAVGASGIFAKTKDKNEWTSWHSTNPNAPVIDEAHHILEDAQGDQWISTSTRGLLRWDPVEETLTEFGSEDGLPSSTVYGGIEDTEGYLWFSTDNGLFRLSSDAEEIEVFDERHGLHETEFNRTGVHVGPSGTAYFSTIDGIVRFNPSAFSGDSKIPPPLVMTSLLHYPSNSKQVDEVLTRYNRENEAKLGSEDDFLSIRFSLLEYTNIPQYFRYRIKNERGQKSENWFPLDRPEINLSGLPSGSSTLEVQARVRGSSWQEPGLSIPISVPFPWYQDPLKIAFLALLAASLVFSVIRIRLRNLRFRNKMLTDMVEDRTQDLKEALELKDIYLKEVHHRVKNNLQIISSLLDLQAAGEPLPETRKAIGSGRSRIESISLIHKHLYLDPTSRNIHISDFIQEYVVMAEDAFIDEKDPVEWHIEGEDILLGIDEAQPFGLLLNELLTNSLQHGAHDSGAHRISIQWRQVSEDAFSLEYRDSGPGLPEDIDPRNPKRLGLRLVNRLTKQLKGTFELHRGEGLFWQFTFKCRFQNRK